MLNQEIWIMGSDRITVEINHNAKRTQIKLFFNPLLSKHMFLVQCIKSIYYVGEISS